MELSRDTTAPKSRKVWEGSALNYWVTCAAWDPFGYGESYEIGIRSKAVGGSFWLVQGGWRTEATAVKVAGAVILMLNGGYTPTEIQEVFP